MPKADDPRRAALVRLTAALGTPRRLADAIAAAVGATRATIDEGQLGVSEADWRAFTAGVDETGTAFLERMIDWMVETYPLTVEEIDEITAFYSSPIGVGIVAKLDLVSAEGATAFEEILMQALTS